MFENEVIVSEVDKREALYHIREVNKILDKYPCSSCFANTRTTISSAKGFSQDAEKWIGYLDTPITQGSSLDCSIALKEQCQMKCDECICKECDKRFNCDGGNPLTGCDE